jgi:hypothetical protein
MKVIFVCFMFSFLGQGVLSYWIALRVEKQIHEGTTQGAVQFLQILNTSPVILELTSIFPIMIIHRNSF